MNIYPIHPEKPDAGRCRVAAYCRVSTEMDSQQTSIDAQKMHYEELIAQNTEWVPAGLYLEAGFSGTHAESRPALMRMLEDCRQGRIDKVLTKSISRFSRNTTDCIRLVRELSSAGVSVVFEKENIDTGTMGTEFFLSLLACFAEEESRNISGNIKWSIRKRFAKGEYIPATAPYGYRRMGNELIPDAAQAETVKRVFDMLLSGYGAGAAAEILNLEKVPGPTGGRWSAATIRQMVKNPVYIGDMLYQKTYTDNEYRIRKNQGELDRYYIADHHEGIVSREIFENTAIVLTRRREKFGNSRTQNTVSENRQVKKISCGSGGLSGKLYCVRCGSPMYRQTSGNYPTYRCSGRIRRTGECRMKGEMEDSIRNAFLTCLNKLACSQRMPADRRILDAYIRRLEKKKEDDGGFPYFLLQEATALRTFISSWEVTDRTEDFSPQVFSGFVEHAEVETGVSIRFRFICGLQLTESVRRPE